MRSSATRGQETRRRPTTDSVRDTVNTASRMESQGLAGCIQVTERTYHRLQNRYHFERRGPIPVRGKTAMVTYLLLGPNPAPTGDR